MNNPRLEGKVAVVTGAGSGIGRCVSQMMTDNGAIVIATDIDFERVEQTQTLIAEQGGQCQAKMLDVTSEQAWQSVLDQVLQEHNKLDVLVNNAGIAPPTSIMDLSLDDFRKVNDVNLHGTFIGCKGAIAAMRACADQGQPAKGSIINIASIAGQLALKGFPAYCTSKAAVTNMCNALGVEMGEAGDLIRVNSVHPGAVKTEMTLAMYGQDYYDNPDNFNFMPSKTYSEVEDVAYAVVYLASDESRLVTGTAMNVDGGTTSGLLVNF